MRRSLLEVSASAGVIALATVLVFESGAPLWTAIEAAFDAAVLVLLGALFALIGAALAWLSGFRPRNLVAGAGIVYVGWPLGVEAALGPSDGPVLFLLAGVLWVGFSLGVIGRAYASRE